MEQTTILKEAEREESKERIKYTATLKGKINDQVIVVYGAGTINLSDGITEGEYEIGVSPEGFSPFFLTAVLITGYPNACASLDDSKNTFFGSAYHYRRALTFRRGGHLSMTAVCSPTGTGLDSHFTLLGEMATVEVDEVEPIVEVWEPLGLNEIAGQFNIAWKKHGKIVASANAESNYYSRNSTQLMPMLHRYIAITSRIYRDGFTLRQKSLLFHRLADNNA
jgi:hypothetical protein